MKKKCMSLSYTTLAVLTMLLFSGFSVVEALQDPSKSTESEQAPTDTPPKKSENTPIVVPSDSVLRLISRKCLRCYLLSRVCWNWITGLTRW